MDGSSWVKRNLEKLGKTRRGKEESKPVTQQKLTELEQFLINEPETYNALKDAIFLDPRKIKEPIDQIEKRASEYEKNKMFVEACMWYRILGGLSIYHGNVSKVRKYFTKAQEMALDASKSPDMYPAYKIPKEYLILKDPKTAVKRAQDFYKMKGIIP
jgi:hypothetical protein